MMSIDEAIAHAREVARINRKQYKNCPADRRDIEHQTCEQCAEEHEQLAEWLEELKEYRDKNKMVVRIDCENMDSIKDKIEELSKYAESQYNKALDDFKKILTIEKIKEYAESDGYINLNNCSLMIFDIAEKLKAGVNNES